MLGLERCAAWGRRSGVTYARGRWFTRSLSVALLGSAVAGCTVHEPTAVQVVRAMAVTGHLTVLKLSVDSCHRQPYEVQVSESPAQVGIKLTTTLPDDHDVAACSDLVEVRVHAL